jgi:hypothetical protein
MSARYERPRAADGQGAAAAPAGAAPAGAAADSATMWESLSRDLDPTDPAQVDGRTRG